MGQTHGPRAGTTAPRHLALHMYTLQPTRHRRQDKACRMGDSPTIRCDRSDLCVVLVVVGKTGGKLPRTAPPSLLANRDMCRRQIDRPTDQWADGRTRTTDRLRCKRGAPTAAPTGGPLPTWPRKSPGVCVCVERELRESARQRRRRRRGGQHRERDRRGERRARPCAECTANKQKARPSAREAEVCKEHDRTKRASARCSNSRSNNLGSHLDHVPSSLECGGVALLMHWAL